MIRPRSATTVRTWLDLGSCAGMASTFVACVGLACALPAFGASDPALRGAGLLLQTAAPWAAAAMLLLALVAVHLGRLRRGRPLDPIGSVEALRSLSRRDFDAVLAESFRLQGYAVEGRPVADDGVGLVLRKPDRKILVRCRRGIDPRVGVEAVRLLHEAMLAEAATGGLIVSCTELTPRRQGSRSRQAYRADRGPRAARTGQSRQTTYSPECDGAVRAALRLASGRAAGLPHLRQSDGSHAGWTG